MSQPRKDSVDDMRAERTFHGLAPDLNELESCCVIERDAETGRPGRGQATQEICGQDDGPKAHDVGEPAERFLAQERQNGREGILCEQLLPAENNDDKAETVSEFGDERLPIGGRKVSGEQAFGD